MPSRFCGKKKSIFQRQKLFINLHFCSVVKNMLFLDLYSWELCTDMILSEECENQNLILFGKFCGHLVGVFDFKDEGCIVTTNSLWMGIGWLWMLNAMSVMDYNRLYCVHGVPATDHCSYVHLLHTCITSKDYTISWYSYFQ